MVTGEVTSQVGLVGVAQIGGEFGPVDWVAAVDRDPHGPTILPSGPEGRAKLPSSRA